MKPSGTWLVRQDSRALQQWGETFKCPQQPRDTRNRPGCALHLLEKVAMDTKHRLDQMSSLEATWTLMSKHLFRKGCNWSQVGGSLNLNKFEHSNS